MLEEGITGATVGARVGMCIGEVLVAKPRHRHESKPQRVRLRIIKRFKLELPFHQQLRAPNAIVPYAVR